jgi:hypothetical protein
VWEYASRYSKRTTTPPRHEGRDVNDDRKRINPYFPGRSVPRPPLARLHQRGRGRGPREACMSICESSHLIRQSSWYADNQPDKSVWCVKLPLQEISPSEGEHVPYPTWVKQGSESTTPTARLLEVYATPT